MRSATEALLDPAEISPRTLGLKHLQHESGRIADEEIVLIGLHVFRFQELELTLGGKVAARQLVGSASYRIEKGGINPVVTKHIDFRKRTDESGFSLKPFLRIVDGLLFGVPGIAFCEIIAAFDAYPLKGILSCRRKTAPISI